MLLAEDSGYLKLLSISSDEIKIMDCDACLNVSYRPEQIALWSNEMALLCYENNIGVVDISNALTLIRTYE